MKLFWKLLEIVQQCFGYGYCCVYSSEVTWVPCMYRIELVTLNVWEVFVGCQGGNDSRWRTGCDDRFSAFCRSGVSVASSIAEESVATKSSISEDIKTEIPAHKKYVPFP